MNSPFKQLSWICHPVLDSNEIISSLPPMEVVPSKHMLNKCDFIDVW